jgi:glucosamine--fructose-6-phosphate aminotransferase (isomerizing)
MTNNMLAQIESLPELIRSQFDPFDANVRRVLDHNEILSTKKVVVTGCGDSYFAGLTTQLAFQTLSGLPIEVLPAMQFARYSATYQSKSFPHNPLVIGVSVSGTVARTVEAIQMARAEGAMTLGITGNPASPLGQAVQKVLDCRIPDFVDAPGVRSYRATMLSLFLLAIRLGEVRGKYTQGEADGLRQQLKDTASALEQTIVANREKVHALAQRVAEHKNFVFVGHGPNLGTALFCAAKVIEASGRHAAGQDTEEYAHLQYFITVDRATPTFLISPQDRGYGRMVELMEPIKRVGRTSVAVVPAGEQQLAAWADVALPVSGAIPEIFTPMVYAAAGELFAAYLAEVLGVGYFGGGMEPYQAGDNTIRTSQIVDRSML